MSIQSGNQGNVIPEPAHSFKHEASSRDEEIKSCFLNQDLQQAPPPRPD